MLALLGYGAFLLTGFGTGLSATQQPIILYAYVSFLLLIFQVIILRHPAPATLVYVFLTSGFAIVYAADFSFFGRNNIFAGRGTTYLVLNTLLFLVFLYDVINRRLARSRPLDGIAGDVPSDARLLPHWSPLSYGSVAVDFAALAIIAYIAWGLLVVIQPLLGVRIALSGFGVPGVGTLPDLDRDIAVGATGIALALVVIASLLAASKGTDTVAVRRFERLNLVILGDAVNDALLSLRLVLGPLLWLLPAFSLAHFARDTVSYLNASAHTPGNPFMNLFNPLSASSVAHAGEGFKVIVLGLLAVGAVIVAVSVIEHSVSVMRRALGILEITGRTLALVSALFFISLAVINAFLILIQAVTVTPFQLGAPVLVALAAFASFLGYSALRTQFTAKG
jgi:hypothetical protein